MGTVLQDLKYALRTFRRAPAFTFIALITIAVGIGANASIFSIVDAVLLRPLPYPHADELVLVSQTNRRTKQHLSDATPANFLDWRVRSRSFAGLAAFRDASIITSAADHPERVAGAMVTANFFDVLQVRPTLGRSFVDADERHGAPRVAILGDGFWHRRFGGRADVIGQTVRLDEEPTTIIGVMPPGIDYPDGVDIWVSPHWHVPDDPQLGPDKDPAPQRTHGYFFVLARLKPGVGLKAAQADMDAVSRGLEHDYPDDLQDVGAAVDPLRSDLIGNIRPTVLVLFAAVALLLLIATANVSGLLIARATTRRAEIALRVALGATRGRIIAQLLTESVLLAAAGGACGILLALWLVGPLVALSPDSLTVAGDVRVDTTVLWFTLAVSLAAGIVFGLAPARQLAGGDVQDDLRHAIRGAGSGGQKRLRGALVVAELALSLVLLVAAGLTVRSFIRLQHVSTGFDVENIVTVRLNPPPVRYPTPRQRADFYEEIVSALRAIPGVQLAGATSRLPLTGGNSSRGLTIPGIPATVPTGADYRTASPEYFKTMGIPLLRGRVFTAQDREDRQLVAVISASLAERFWPNRDPIGLQFSINDPPITIVGVVGDVHYASLDSPVVPTVYVPYRQDPFPFMTAVVRSPAPYASLASAIRNAVWSVDGDQPVGEIKTMDAQLSNSLSRRRFGVTLLTAFGSIAVVLAAIGLYGVLAFIVAQRRREIGVRMALGASRGAVVSDVLGHGLKLAVLGVGCGLLLSLGLTRAIQSLLYGTSATDVMTFAGVSALLVTVAAFASLAPALRASRVDPITALRED